MGEIIITPDGAKVLRAMIVSCGTAGCFESILQLEDVKSPTPLSEIGMTNDGHWRMAAFSRLKDYAISEGISELSKVEVVRYFSGTHHIEIMSRISDHAGLGQYLGPFVGLVTHILLPLTADQTYRNNDITLNFKKAIEFNPKEKGVPCYHLGTITRIVMTENQLEGILAQQYGSDVFKAAAKKITAPIVPPEEYLNALNCTIKKATD